ncbi:MAG TPA: hypothetical protein PLS70_17875 [Acidobacteriota bacterium]|nr:hypothetical protein [Acidobacteriota bacterium]
MQRSAIFVCAVFFCLFTLVSLPIKAQELSDFEEDESEILASDLTPVQIEKIKRAEAAADQFIKRWQETLDLRIVSQEMYARNSFYQLCNAFQVIHILMFISGKSSIDPIKVKNELGLEAMQELNFAFWNLAHISDEFELAKTEKELRLQGIPCLMKAKAKESVFKYNQNRPLDVKTLKLMISTCNNANLCIQKELGKDFYKTKTYQDNYQKARTENRPSKMYRDWSDWGLFELEVVKVERGEFEIYLVEEDGEMRVLTLGYEL